MTDDRSSVGWVNSPSPEPLTGLPKTRSQKPTRPASASATTLPYRSSNASLSSLFASTSTLPSRAGSAQIDTPSQETGSESLFLTASPGAVSSPTFLEDRSDDPRKLITRAFVPHVAVHASPDTDEILKEKGFEGGFREILRPFGERVHGKVTVRDSVGASRTWDDFGVRFVGLGDGIEDPRNGNHRNSNALPRGSFGSLDQGQALPGLRRGGDISAIEALVERHLAYAELVSGDYITDYLNYQDLSSQSSSSISPFFSLYLRRLLSAIPLTPHETFSHPVACVIAISSRNPSPIESLRQLYNTTSQGEKKLPVWVNNDYLRYYVLVHDEDKDDIAKSTVLFDQMKRHFGLHCHLLRLRSSQCLPTDDDSVRLPICNWISAAEELAEIQRREHSEDIEDPRPCLFDSDATAVRTFVREMVTQSIVPFMERCTATWNDQVASRRRGIGGRFISLSKRWTGFGAGRSSSGTGLAGGSTGSNSNYDALQGFYRPDAPEAIMRKLADYAFMLRDWKLAQSTYELLRTDFNNDKAWRYHAGANEMTAISTLLSPQAMTSKTRSETIDQMLDTAAYSYITRCSAPYDALRSLAVGAELLRIRGGSAADDASRWAIRILETRTLGEIGNALFTERVGACYGSRKGAGTGRWGSRRRKNAMWDVLAADIWLRLEKSLQAEKCLNNADALYQEIANGQERAEFDGMRSFIEELRVELQARRAPPQPAEGELEMANEQSNLMEVESEKMDQRHHRQSILGAPAAPFGTLDTDALSSVRTVGEQNEGPENQFEPN
ncbi:hypothetical protein L228DRAFT_260082 [Xylona heveae TC161]|uniref:TRAPP complex protein TRS85 n=1 Tax=Xylona heveae (strain CBS 132557 / TC161) TaxID=1328760 RepID=A0A165HAW0_XYLHT|nr:hypothetical protein L228DRAFT_260082 [Xylona heveae TC161]KZF23231.1 hypothetical protein L228DRAFT_260082 [Xylona heveae TC161]